MSKSAKNPLFFLTHIQESIAAIETYLQGDKTRFLSDRMVQKAVLYELITIGEAVKNIPDEFKETHPEVPWRDLVDFRNVLTHHYWGVSLEVVGKILENPDKLPTLKRQIDSFIEQLKRS
jgi:uncharacterized protein with HEPN domain